MNKKDFMTLIYILIGIIAIVLFIIWIMNNRNENMIYAQKCKQKYSDKNNNIKMVHIMRCCSDRYPGKSNISKKTRCFYGME